MPYENVQTNEEFLQTLVDCGFEYAEVEIITSSVVPGYLAEQRKPESRKEIYRIRGQIWGRLSDYLDDFVGWLYKRGLVDYVLIRGQKPDPNDLETPEEIDFSKGVRGAIRPKRTDGAPPTISTFPRIIAEKTKEKDGK